MKKIIIITAVAVSALLGLQSCDNYLDIEPKGRAQLESTDDYLGLIEGAKQYYEHYDGWYISNEASWYKVMELKNYTSPMRSVGFFGTTATTALPYSLRATFITTATAALRIIT